MPRAISFTQAPFDEIEAVVRQHLAALPGPIDAFVEEHILNSAHFRIEIAGAYAGFASVHQNRRITQFALAESFRADGTRAFWELRHLSNVQSAYIPSSDQFYLAHGLDDQRRVSVQAFLFAASLKPAPVVADPFSLRAMVESDADLVHAHAGDFLDRIAERITAGELFVTTRHGEPVGFGIAERSLLLDTTASIGMFTIERFRGLGVGSATIALLIAECQRQGLTPAAGCWFYNHPSKRALERGGMHAEARLLKIDY